jgi:SAM-dependent methyltransferase
VIVRQTEAGTTWSELARLDPLAAVLDPEDSRGRKNRLIDRVHKRALASAVGDLRGARVLDFGCGTGRLARWLVEHRAEVEGVDVTPEMIEVARSMVPDARFHAIAGTTLPFGDDSFDLAVTAYVLQYYVDDDASVVRDIARVLRPSGRLVAIEQVTQSDIGRGATVQAYERMLSHAGFAGNTTSLIRNGESHVLGIAARVPLVSRLPAVPWLVMREAARDRDAPLSGGRYADALFDAVKEY